MDQPGVCREEEEKRTPGQGRKGGGNGFCAGRSQGQGKGMMNGQGRGPNFIDADNNGVCDRYENLQKDQEQKN